jgi:hypothetical protein
MYLVFGKHVNLCGPQGRLWKAEWFFKDTNSLISGPLNIMKKKDFTDIIMVLEIEKLSWSQTGAAEGKS